jgi:hypothetical protein
MLKMPYLVSLWKNGSFAASRRRDVIRLIILNIMIKVFSFMVGGKPENLNKTLEARERTNKQLYSHMIPSPEIEPGPQR